MLYPLGRPLVSLVSRPSSSVLSALGPPAFTSATTGPYLNLPSTTLPTTTSSAAAGATAPTISSTALPGPIASPPQHPHLPSYISNKISALPKKLKDSILAWEYVDLSELLPEQLRINSSSASSKEVLVIPESSWDTRRRKKRQITDIATWIEVFSTYTLVLVSLFPEYLPHLVSYQLTIVKLSKWFRYPSWLYYNLEFRKWAATNCIKDWSKSNSELFALAFRGASLTWCPICQVEGEHTYDCPRFLASTPSPTLPEQLPRKTIPNLLQPQPKCPAPAHCILYDKNAGACPYGLVCKYRHVCSSCSNPHPVSSCPHKPSRQM